MTVVGVVSINTKVGQVDAYEIRSEVRGINGTDYVGQTVSFWAPSLKATVYERNSSGNRWSEVSLVAVTPPN